MKAVHIICVALATLLPSTVSAQEYGDRLALPRNGASLESTTVFRDLLEKQHLAFRDAPTGVIGVAFGARVVLFERARLQAAVYGTVNGNFLLGRSGNDLLYSDWTFQAPLTVHLGKGLAVRAGFHHHSAHLGDEAMANDKLRFWVYSRDAIRATAHVQHGMLDAYVGGERSWRSWGRRTGEVMRAGFDAGWQARASVVGGGYAEYDRRDGLFLSEYAGYQSSLWGQAFAILVRRNDGRSRLGQAFGVAEKTTAIEIDWNVKAPFPSR